MKKILTIDFDFIMAPCIELYNTMVRENENHEKLWDIIYTTLDCKRFMSYDEDNFKFLCEIIKGLKCPVYVGPDHTSILRMMDEIYAKDPTFTGPFSIVNVDHHHDLGYHVEQMRDIYEFDYPQCGSWVMYLGFQRLIDNYYWIGNENSKPYNLEEIPSMGITIMTKEDYKHNPQQFDACFISSSLNWIPPEMMPIYFAFLRILIQQYGDNIMWYSNIYNHHKMALTINKSISSTINEEITN